jgi:hypothetical protein
MTIWIHYIAARQEDANTVKPRRRKLVRRPVPPVPAHSPVVDTLVTVSLLAWSTRAGENTHSS